MFGARTNGKPLSDDHPGTYPLNVGLYGDFKREIEAKPTGKTAVTYFIMNGIEQSHAKRTNKEGKKAVP